MIFRLPSPLVGAFDPTVALFVKKCKNTRFNSDYIIVDSKKMTTFVGILNGPNTVSTALSDLQNSNQSTWKKTAYLK